jgi:hypothetical protein
MGGDVAVGVAEPEGWADSGVVVGPDVSFVAVGAIVSVAVGSTVGSLVSTASTWVGEGWLMISTVGVVLSPPRPISKPSPPGIKRE